MKSLILAKFGGSTFGMDGAEFPTIVERIRALQAGSEVGPLVVVSAPRTRFEGKERSLTDVALHFGERYADFSPVAPDALFRPYTSMIERFIAPAWKGPAMEALEKARVKVKHALNQILENRRVVDVNRARLLAYAGELLMGAVVDYGLRSVGLMAWHPTPDEWPIVTDDNFENASPLWDQARPRVGLLAEHLAAGELPVIGGYIGVTRDGLETTFERGGSDRTAADLAVLLAAHYQVTLHFEKEEIVMSGDPRVVADAAEPVMRLSYNETELAGRFGAKIVDPLAIADILASATEIPLVITHVHDPARKTEIRRTAPWNGENPVKMVTGKADCAVVELRKAQRQSLEDFLRLVRRYDAFMELRPFERDGIEYGRFLFLDGAYVRRFERELQSFDSTLRIAYGLGALTLVGDEMKRQPGVAAKAFQAIFDAGINVEDCDIQQPTSSILIVVAQDRLADALRAVHTRTRMTATAPTAE
jgi:aspartate kinase